MIKDYSRRNTFKKQPYDRYRGEIKNKNTMATYIQKKNVDYLYSNDLIYEEKYYKNNSQNEKYFWKEYYPKNQSETFTKPYQYKQNSAKTSYYKPQVYYEVKSNFNENNLKTPQNENNLGKENEILKGKTSENKMSSDKETEILKRKMLNEENGVLSNYDILHNQNTEKCLQILKLDENSLKEDFCSKGTIFKS